jgi:2,3-bisphosphoglycerate-independent phosphoglycerate mutase
MLKPVVLVILDGWGIGKNDRSNAIAQAKLPTIEKLNRFYPSVALQASGISVGLLWGEPGNSEAGHKTIGSGKIVYQSLPKIIIEIQNGEFFKNPAFLRATENTKKFNSALHLMGLVGTGAVHSSMDHFYALWDLAKEQQVQKVFLHLFTDGRDSGPEDCLNVIRQMQEKLKAYPNIKIASLIGRYFAMDRNNNWDRTQKAYNLLTQGLGTKTTDPADYLQKSYSQKVFDEYLEPAIVVDEQGEAYGKIKENDSVIFFNFREDRARQITKAFTLPGFSKFARTEIKNLYFTAMTEYEEGLPIDVAYASEKVANPLGKIISHQSFSQLRIAETEKFAHVTYFFNGGMEDPFTKEERMIVPSPVVDRFDKVPVMSADKITEKVLNALELKKYQLIVMNYANPDIVGHTGNKAATIQAVEKVDECLSRLIPAVLLANGCLLITADHGNAECLENVLTGEVNTEHTTNPVPLWLVTNENHTDTPKNVLPGNGQGEVKTVGIISDIAPTILDILGIPKPNEMTGESLLPLLK